MIYLAIFLKSFFVLVLIWLVARPLSIYVHKRMKEGKLKRILFFSWKV